jgi:DNA-binding CsgD family transcriptional regulator
MDDRSFDDIVGDVYEAAAGRVDWRRPFERIASGLDLWMCHMIGVDKRTGTLLFSHEGGPNPIEVPLDYLRTYHAVNPRIAPALTLGDDEWLHCHEHFPAEFVAADPFYQEFLIPFGGRYLSGTKIVDNAETLVLFAALRGVGNSPLDRDEINCLDRIKRHLSQAFRIRQHLRDVYSELHSGREILNQFRYPMLLVDEQRTIRFRNSAAESALNDTDYIVDRGGILGCREARADIALTVAIHELRLHSDDPAKLPRRAYCRLERMSNGASIDAFVSAIRPRVAMSAFGHEPLALIVCHDPHDTQVPDVFIVAEAFHLTPAEARIAVKLAEGLDLDQIAAEVHVSINTVRTQVKAAMAKMGVSRQAEIVRLLLNVPNLMATSTMPSRRF